MEDDGLETDVAVQQHHQPEDANVDRDQEGTTSPPTDQDGEEPNSGPALPPDFGSARRQIEQNAGLSFRVTRPRAGQQRRGTAPSLGADASSGPTMRSRSLAGLDLEEDEDRDLPVQEQLQASEHDRDPALAAAANDDDDDEEEILVIEGVTAPTTQAASFDVFLNLPDADQNTPVACAEYAGSYYHLPHPGPPGREVVRNVRLGVGATIKRLGISDLEHLVVTLVQRGAGPDDAPITISGVRIEYE